MLGVDLEEPDEETRKKNMNEEELSNLEATKERVKYEIQDVLDFGGYHLGNDGLQAIIPLLCQDYLLNIKSLDLSYNNLNDNGLDVLIQNMASLGSTVEELNISGNMISDIEINKISDFIRTGKLRRLWNVIAEDCKITDAGYRALKIAMMKAE